MGAQINVGIISSNVDITLICRSVIWGEQTAVGITTNV
ncbi:hypothetical protein SynBIOSU31_01978 [Synechococcus sp. BIOS-U3-1]|nr:hypothetical protein SynBIOSU31_01978 [Synechococcus sp. BIOS-U3-1]